MQNFYTFIFYLFSKLHSMPTQKEEITGRVRGIFEELRRTGKVKFNRDFLGFTGLKDSTMSMLLSRNSKRDLQIPEKYYEAIRTHWNVTESYFYKGKGPMFEKPVEQKDLMIELNENLKAVLKELKKLNAR